MSTVLAIIGLTVLGFAALCAVVAVASGMVIAIRRELRKP